MARMTFGGTAADFVASVGPAGTIKALPATLTFWSAKAGGTRYTDLMLNGAAATQVVTGADGQVPAFQGPDGITTMWADAGSGRVRMGSEITPAAISDSVASAMDSLGTGAMLGPAERTTLFQTTSTSATSTAGDIPGITISVTGTGRPIHITAFLPNAYHSVANTKVNAGITLNGDVLSSLGSQVGGVFSPQTADGVPLTLHRVTGNLAAGTTYTIGVRIWGGAAGTSSVNTGAFAPIQLSAIRR